MRRAIYLISSILLASSGSLFARSIGPASSLTYERVRSGLITFPAAYCPDVDPQYEELTEKLGSL